ncbi:MAG: ABC transporter permease, partial [Candidatus Puniceispirillales bacterium]
LAPEAVTGLGLIQDRIDGLTRQLEEGSAGLVPDAAAFDQAPWGVTNNEIPLMPMTSRGVLYDQVAMQAQAISKDFLSLRNMPEGAEQIIAETRVAIAGLKDAGAAADEDRAAYIKAVERIFRRLDDGVIFPADTMQGINASMNTLTETVDDSMGSLGFVEKAFFPGGAVIKTRTICIEQGSSRWLPKPLDVVAKLGQLSNPDLDAGGGYKGTRLLWW